MVARLQRKDVDRDERAEAEHPTAESAARAARCQAKAREQRRGQRGRDERRERGHRGRPGGRAVLELPIVREALAAGPRSAGRETTERAAPRRRVTARGAVGAAWGVATARPVATMS